jgi:hypothetical protein
MRSGEDAMDAMALLCTLHADGPATLKRLRQAGCDSIGAVGRLDADRLASLLETSPAAARRFLREAVHLSERVDASFFEREERDASERAPRETSVEAREAVTAPSAARERSSPLGYRDQRIVAQVLEAWRKHDTEEPPSSSAPTPREIHSTASAPAAPESRPDGDNGRSAIDSDGRENARRESRSLESAVAAELAPGSVDGMDSDTCLRLRAAGVHTIASLASADPLTLSHGIGIGYTRLSRLCSLARRAQAASSAASAHTAEDPARTASSHPNGSFVSDGASAFAAAKFSRAGTPSIGVMSALAADLEIHVGPKPVLPSRTRWFPAAAESDDGSAGGPFA